MRRVLKIIAFAVFALSAFLVARYYMRSDESRVRAVIDDLIADLKNDNVPLSLWGIRGNLAEDYAHREEMVGKVDRELALAYMSALKQNAGLVAFEVDIREMRIRIEGDTARVTVTGRVTAEKRDERGKPIEVMTEPGLNQAHIDLRKINGKWLVTGSERLRYQLPH